MIEKTLRQQFVRAQAEGWIGFFEKAAAPHRFEPALLMAIASRETQMRNILGDGGHGHGLMQIDDRSFPAWCASGLWRQPEQAIRKGAEVLAEKRSGIQSGQGKTLRIGKKRFVGKAGLDEETILRIAVAAYNCGLWAYYNFSLKGDPDAMTTGHDYSKDVMARSAVFTKLSSTAKIKTS